MEQNLEVVADKKPAVMLTIGELRALLRVEIRAALAPSGTTDFPGGIGKPNASVADKPYLSVKEAADLARVGPSTIRLYIRKGQLRRRKVGRRVIISRAELERFLGSQSPKVVELYPT